ncbi:MAG TPA: nicotinate-nucleotide adenylyltransferase [Candidatus Omnitrophota bacterium]|nr:nicotinate-nucleotide adenylyltransferase [Candidatus Omnitrophota bacterium]
MKRIGILGGTFNPIHIGHLVIAEKSREEFNLDQVFFVPCYVPPHKSREGLMSVKDRFNMVRLGVKDNPAFCASDFEIKRKQKSYTIDTVLYFKNKWPKSKLFFIIGGDMLAGLKDWKDIEKIVKLSSFIVVNRPGNSAPHKSIAYHSIKFPGIDVSSSYIRRCLRKKESIRYLVPDEVARYIRQHKLFKV